MIRATSSTEGAQDRLQRIRLAVQDGAFDQPVEIAAWRTQRGLVEATPKRYTGLTRREWKVEKVGEGARLVVNRSKVMLFLEEGTGNAGTATSNGGYIYPKSKKFLFVPLNQRSTYGWNSSLKWGIDYVLARRVRGIKAMRIISKYRDTALGFLKEEMRKFLERVIK